MADFELIERSDDEDECDNYYACDFCGRAEGDVDRVIVGSDASVCDNCIETMVKIIRDESNDDFCR